MFLKWGTTDELFLKVVLFFVGSDEKWQYVTLLLAISPLPRSARKRRENLVALDWDLGGLG